MDEAGSDLAAIRARSNVVGGSFSSDKARLEPLIKAAFQHKGAAFIDVIRLASRSTTALARPRASITWTGAILPPTPVQRGEAPSPIAVLTRSIG
jgi:hypothetical protein